MSRLLLIILILSLPAAGKELGLKITPQKGQEVSPEEINNTIINPDGSGLPQGSGSVHQGKKVYELHCQSCHGVDGKTPGLSLTGGKGSLAGSRPLKTIGSFWPHAPGVFDYVARAMPYNKQKSLSVEDTYAVTAYLLFLNGLLDAEAIVDRESLPKIDMPNKNGFVEIID